MMRFITFALCLTLAAVAANAQDEPARQPTPGDNLAAGRECSFDPAPNYKYCKDADDPFQLTDGLYNGCVWTDQGTVGWAVRREPVFLVDIDLGEAAPIGAMTFDTVTGGAQVTFPAAALAFVSEDGQSYRYLGDIFTESLPQDKGLNHRFVADGLKGWGRYVRIAIISGGFYLFCDEIEIMRGDNTAAESSYASDEVIEADAVRAWANEKIAWVTQKNATLTILREAAVAIEERAPLVKDQALVDAARAAVAAGERSALNDAEVTEPDYTQGPPYRAADGAVFEAIARMNADIWSDRPYIVWEHPDWEWLHLPDAPAPDALGAEVSVEMMQNEFATASFVLTSCSDKPIALNFVVGALRGPENLKSSDVLDVAQVVHVEAFGYNYRDDAIVPLREGPFMLKPGVSKRFWLTFRTRGQEIEPGNYTSSVIFLEAGETVATVPIKLRVWPVRFPDETTLASNSWAYFDEKTIVGHEEDAARDLLDHYNTALTVNHRYLPKPAPDAEGNLPQMDFSKLSALIDLNPDTRMWLIWPGFEFGFDRLGTSEFGGPVWEKVFAQYVTQTRDFLATKGIGTDQFAWYWIDEPSGAKWNDICIPASRMLKRVDPNMLVWSDPTRRVSREELEAGMSSVDILCPSLGHIVARGGSQMFLKTALPSWMYVCASEKNASPFGYYRWLSWKTWDYGLQGIGMWVYTDYRATTFSDYVSGVSYAMAYGGTEGMIGSKRWDAWRQGIADYEYLHMLTGAVAEAKAAGRAPEAIARAEVILTDGVAEVIGDQPYLGPPEGWKAAERIRLEILQCIVDLRG